MASNNHSDFVKEILEALEIKTKHVIGISIDIQYDEMSVITIKSLAESEGLDKVKEIIAKHKWQEDKSVLAPNGLKEGEEGA